MRQSGGRAQRVGWVALYALSACSSGLRVPSESPVVTETCAPTAAPSRTADSAFFAFTASGLARDVCAARLAAALLRPWAAGPTAPWTVQVAIIDSGAAVHRLDAAGARDALDTGRAHLVTEDADLIAYARQRGLVVEPLPWDRLYLAVVPNSGDTLGAVISPDAVRADARSVVAPRCEPDSQPETSGTVATQSRRIVYETGDVTAREVAERLVGVAGDTAIAAAGLAPTEFAAALRTGAASAFVVSVAPSGLECQAVATIVPLVPWAAAFIPLIETRAHVIAPRP